MQFLSHKCQSWFFFFWMFLAYRLLASITGLYKYYIRFLDDEMCFCQENFTRCKYGYTYTNWLQLPIKCIIGPNLHLLYLYICMLKYICMYINLKTSFIETEFNPPFLFLFFRYVKNNEIIQNYIEYSK